MSRQETTTIAILGSNPVINNALSLLLEGEGYTTRFIWENLEGLADGLLEGVDVLLLSPHPQQQ